MLLTAACLQSPGNHEFDYGPANLAGFATALSTPMVRCAGGGDTQGSADAL